MRAASLPRRLLALLVDAVYPVGVVCLSCGAVRNVRRETGLCPACTALLKRFEVPLYACPRCQTPYRAGKKRRCAFCRAGGLAGMESAYAPYLYAGPAAALVRALKYAPVAQAAGTLARAMAGALPPHARFDALVPVPMHGRRLRARGIDHAAELTRALSAQTGIPVLPALLRTRDTPQQARLSGAARRNNLKNAFALAQDVTGLTLLLVDDVRTTGETARRCALALRAGGAKAVYLVTAAVSAKG